MLKAAAWLPMIASTLYAPPAPVGATHAMFDQSREGLDGSKTVWEDVSGGLDILTVGKFEMPSRAYCGRFNFNGGDQQKKVGMLSGGERGRLHLAKTLIKGGNVLLLDEPSNDLDVETLRALEDALLEFAKPVVTEFGSLHSQCAAQIQKVIELYPEIAVWSPEQIRRDIEGAQAGPRPRRRVLADAGQRQELLDGVLRAEGAT